MINKLNKNYKKQLKIVKNGIKISDIISINYNII